MKLTAASSDSSNRSPKLTQLADRFGNTFYFGNAGDYWHPPFPIGSDTDYRTHVSKIRDFQIRDEDVLLCSYPKTGTHWHYEIMQMLMRRKTEHTLENELDVSFMDMTSAEITAEAPSPRLLVTHVPFRSRQVELFGIGTVELATHSFRHLPRQAFEKRIKIVFIERNPKDVIVSLYNQLNKQKPPMHFPGTFEQFLYLNLECGFYYGNLFDYLLDWQNGRNAHPEIEIFVSVFEDMKLDPVDGVLALNDYLDTGCSEELCADIAEACSFENLKAFKEAHSEKKSSDRGLNTVSLYRKGDVGDWKNWFTVAMNEQFDQEFERRMADYQLKYKFSL